MTPEEKAKEYAWDILDKRCDRVKCQETSCKPYEREQNELHTRCRARYHCLRGGYLAGHASRDIEVAGLVTDNEKYQTAIAEAQERANIQYKILSDKRREIERQEKKLKDQDRIGADMGRRIEELRNGLIEVVESWRQFTEYSTDGADRYYCAMNSSVEDVAQLLNPKSKSILSEGNE